MPAVQIFMQLMHELVLLPDMDENTFFTSINRYTKNLSKEKFPTCPSIFSYPVNTNSFRDVGASQHLTKLYNWLFARCY